jgi:hypothetical protein
VIGFWKLRAGESGNISHGCPSKVKEMLKEFGDDPFGMTKSFWVTMEGGALRRLCTEEQTRFTRARGARSSIVVVLAGIADVFE